MNLQITAAPMQKMPDFCILLTLLKFCCSSNMLLGEQKQSDREGDRHWILSSDASVNVVTSQRAHFYKRVHFITRLLKCGASKSSQAWTFFAPLSSPTDSRRGLLLEGTCEANFTKKVGPLRLKQLTDLLQHSAFKCAHIIYA